MGRGRSRVPNAPPTLKCPTLKFGEGISNTWLILEHQLHWTLFEHSQRLVFENIAGFCNGGDCLVPATRGQTGTHHTGAHGHQPHGHMGTRAHGHTSTRAHGHMGTLARGRAGAQARGYAPARVKRFRTFVGLGSRINTIVGLGFRFRASTF